MQLSHSDHCSPVPDSAAPAAAVGRTSGWLSRCAAGSTLLAVTLAVSACGSSSPAKILNTEKIERAIEHASLSQRGEHAQVSCPSGVYQKQGLVFSCSALVGRVSTLFVVTELDASGRVHYAAR